MLARLARHRLWRCCGNKAPVTPDGGTGVAGTPANDKWLESAKTNRDMVQAVLNSSRGTEPSAVRANCSRTSAPYDTRMGIIPLGLCGHSLHCQWSER